MKFFKCIIIIIFATSCLFSDQLVMEKDIQQKFENSAQQFHISKTPSWVRDIEYEKEDIEENIDAKGVAFLLYSRQYNLEKRTRYIRKAKKFVSTAIMGEGSTIPIAFDFKQYDLTLHHVNIIRNGKIIEKLTTAKKKCFYPQASGSNLQQITLFVDKLRVGDIIDIGYSLIEKENFLLQPFPGEIFDIKDLSLCKKIVYDCLVEKDTPFYWKTYQFKQDPVCSFWDNYKVYSWEINEYDIEYFPATSESARDLSIIISINTWNEIAQYFAASFKEKTKFFPTPPEEIRLLMKKWEKNYPTLEEKILAAIRFVSDDIYYLSIPDDEEEHYTTPYSPEETLEKRYGDCKDKTALLIALLNLLNVEAFPVLVNSEKTNQNQLPNDYFDHLIVNIQHNGNFYFIDPTSTLQGGTLDTYQTPDFGYGLIIREDTEDLVPILRNFLSKVQFMATISIQNSEINWDHVTQEYYHQADTLRRSLIPGYINRKEKKILSKIKELFPDAEVIYTSPLQIEDDRYANVITKKFSIFGKNLGNKTPTATLYDLDWLMTEVSVYGGTNTSEGLFLETYNIPKEIYKTIDIHCDKFLYIEEKSINYADENLAYYITIEKTSDTDIRVSLYEEIFKNYIDENELPRFYKKLEEFNNHLKLQIEIPD